MNRLTAVFLGLAAIVSLAGAAEVPCGIADEADRITARAKSELGLYSAVIIPHVTKIRENGARDIAAADAEFDKLAAQARKDGYDIKDLVAQLKAFNRHVAECKEYPAYLKQVQAEKERAAKAREAKKQADLVLQKQKEEEERLARIEAERLEREREAQRLIDQENARKQQEAERKAREAAEYQSRLDQKAAELAEGCVIRIPPRVSYSSSVESGLLGQAKVFTAVQMSGDRYVLELKDIREVSDTSQSIDPVDVIFKAVKKRKKYVITLAKEDFLKISVLAANEKIYRRR